MTATSAALPADPVGMSKEANPRRHSSPAAGIRVNVGGTSAVVSRTLTASPAAHEEVRGIDVKITPAHPVWSTDQSDTRRGQPAPNVSRRIRLYSILPAE